MLLGEKKKGGRQCTTLQEQKNKIKLTQKSW